MLNYLLNFKVGIKATEGKAGPRAGNAPQSYKKKHI